MQQLVIAPFEFGARQLASSADGGSQVTVSEGDGERRLALHDRFPLLEIRTNSVIRVGADAPAPIADLIKDAPFAASHGFERENSGGGHETAGLLLEGEER